LRCAILVVLLAGSLTHAALARVPLKVLVGAPVADTARAAMSPSLWGKLLADWVGAAQVVAFPNGLPALGDCKSAGADFMVAAPFELRPRLPGMPNSSGRVAARTELTITNCLTGSVVYDQTVDLDSEPPADPATGIDAAAIAMWAKDVPAELVKYPAFFSRIARIVRVEPTTALVDLHGAKPGDVMRIYATSAGKLKAPIYLTVKRQVGKNAEVTFSTLAGVAPPAVGDFVEPVPKLKP
jgi:hypothetical protein